MFAQVCNRRDLAKGRTETSRKADWRRTDARRAGFEKEAAMDGERNESRSNRRARSSLFLVIGRNGFQEEVKIVMCGYKKDKIASKRRLLLGRIVE